MTTLDNVSIACWMGMHQECAELATKSARFAKCPCKCHAFQRKDKKQIKK